MAYNVALYEVLKGFKCLQSYRETSWKAKTDPIGLGTNCRGRWLRPSLSVPCWKLCNQWTRKTIVCHLVTRSYCRKACKHTAIPLVTPGALFPLSNSSLCGGDMCSHGWVRDWVPVFALLTHLARRITLISGGEGGVAILWWGPAGPPTTPWGSHMVCGPAQSIPPSPNPLFCKNTCTHREACLCWG